MPEKDTVFKSKIKYEGIFSFKDLYQFCHDWLIDEISLNITENKYKEKLVGNSKKIEVEWTCERKVTDYFKFEIKVVFNIIGLIDVEIVRNERKEKSNKGLIEIGVNGNLVRDYEGKFEKNAFLKFLRSIYEKWIIKARVEQFENKLIDDCNEFLNQAKAYLDLEGKK